ncbi:unnamed protein product, partial [Caretta caretta]
MLLPPGHPALLLLAGILLAAAAQDPRYQITQPESLSALAGVSVTLPCNFTYPREIEPLQDLRVYWRLGFHGQFIYNHTERFTHPDYGGRIVLVGDPRGSRTASICINRLQESDAGEYVCHITVRKNNGQWEQWRCHPGTQLTVTAQASATHAPSTERTMTQGATQRPAGQGAAPVIGGGAGGGRPAGRDHRTGCVRRPEETRCSAEGPPGPEGARPVAGRKRVHGHRGRRAGCLPRAPAPPGPPGPRFALRCPGLHRDRRCPAAARPPRGPHGRDPLLSRPGAL